MTHQVVPSAGVTRTGVDADGDRVAIDACGVPFSANEAGPRRRGNAAERLDRRAFLSSAAAAVAATAPLTMSLGGEPQKKRGWEMKLSTSSLHYRSLPLEEACQRIGKLGFSGVDVWAHFEWAGPLCEHLEEGVEKMGPAAFSDLLQRNGLSLFAASCYSASVSKFLPALGELGGCVVVRGSRSIQGSAAALALDDLKTQMAQFVESLKPELELAEQHRCTLAIENHSGRSLLNRLDSIKVFTDLNEHQNLGIALAPYHIQLNKESVEQAIRLSGSQLKFFYAWQYGDGTNQLPGIGPTDVRPWLQALADVNYGGYVNPFMHHEPEPDDMDEALATSRAYLQQAYADVFR